MTDEAPLKVGDFVVISHRTVRPQERLGRIERIEGDLYQVRSLMPHRRWAQQTTPQRREWLTPASHDFVRAKLGLEVGTTATLSLALAANTLPGGEAVPPRPSQSTLHRASPAAERSLAARVLAPLTAPPPPAPARAAPTPTAAGPPT